MTRVTKWSDEHCNELYSHFSPKIFIFINVLNAYSYPRISRKCDFKTKILLRECCDISPTSNINICKLFQQYLWKSIPQTYDIFIKIFTYNPQSLVTSFQMGSICAHLCMFTKISISRPKMRNQGNQLEPLFPKYYTVVIVSSHNLQNYFMIFWQTKVLKIRSNSRIFVTWNLTAPAQCNFVVFSMY